MHYWEMIFFILVFPFSFAVAYGVNKGVTSYVYEGRVGRIDIHSTDESVSFRWLKRGEASRKLMIEREKEWERAVEDEKRRDAHRRFMAEHDIRNKTMQDAIDDLLHNLFSGQHRQEHQRHFRPAAKPVKLKYLAGLEGASDEQIKTAFRKLARKLHPDVNSSPTADADFRTLQSEYEQLSTR